MMWALPWSWRNERLWNGGFAPKSFITHEQMIVACCRPGNKLDAQGYDIHPRVNVLAG
jgi:hypothetical protein